MSDELDQLLALIRPLPDDEYTPFHRVLNSSDLGVDLWAKREDLIDGIGSGHKARKLKYIIEDAVINGATVLMTAASPPSGQAVAMTAAANSAGLRSHIVYCGG